MRRDHPLASRESVTPDDLRHQELICSRRDPRNPSVRNPYVEWFGGSLEKLHVVAVHNLIQNASLLVERGMGTALTLEPKNINGDKLCFRPFQPKLVFSKAAELFLDRVREHFGDSEAEQTATEQKEIDRKEMK